MGIWHLCHFFWHFVTFNYGVEKLPSENLAILLKWCTQYQLLKIRFNPTPRLDSSKSSRKINRRGWKFPVRQSHRRSLPRDRAGGQTGLCPALDMRPDRYPLARFLFNLRHKRSNKTIDDWIEDFVTAWRKIPGTQSHAPNKLSLSEQG